MDAALPRQLCGPGCCMGGCFISPRCPGHAGCFRVELQLGCPRHSATHLFPQLFAQRAGLLTEEHVKHFNSQADALAWLEAPGTKVQHAAGLARPAISQIWPMAGRA